MKIAILFSGGKDSTYTVFRALEEGHEVKYLFTVIPENSNSYMFHSVCLEITEIQAALLGIPHFFIRVSGEKEKEVNELLSQLLPISKEIDAIGIGGIRSRYQYERFKKIADSLNLKLYSPLLNIDCEKYWKELLKNKFKIIITKVSAAGLDEDLLGKVIDEKILDLLIKRSRIYGFDLCFEGGEAETLVLDCPIFSKEIEIKKLEVKKDENSAWISIKEIEVKQKI